MNEVIFLRLIRQFRREIHCADLRFVLLFALGSLLLGLFSFILGGGHSLYHHICLPHFAPSAFAMWLIWTFVYLMIGAAAGIVFSTMHCCRIRPLKRGILWWSIGLALNLIWFPLFFGVCAWFFALLLIPLMIFFTFLTIRSFVRTSLLSAFLMLLYAIWLFVCFFLQFVVILCN